MVLLLFGLFDFVAWRLLACCFDLICSGGWFAVCVVTLWIDIARCEVCVCIVFWLV